MIRYIAIAVTALALSAGAAQAAYYNLTAPVAGHPGVTYFDLVRTLVPDLKLVDQHGVGTTASQVRYVEDLGDADEDPAPTADINIQSVEVLPIEVGGKPWTLMLTDLGSADGWASNYEIMALFDENLKLSDAINVGLDRMTEMVDLINVSEAGYAVLTHSEHFNSNQTYGGFALVMVRDGKFTPVGTFYTLSDRWCGHLRTQTLEIASASASSGPGFWPVTVIVNDKLEVPAEDLEDGGCGDAAAIEKPFEIEYSATYTWSASLGQYITEGDAFDRLGDINSDRY